jgi:hypothetical protein
MSPDSASPETPSTPHVLQAIDVHKAVWLVTGCASAHPDLTLSHIDARADLEWDWTLLSKRDITRPWFVQKHKDKPWDWHALSRHLALAGVREHKACLTIQRWWSDQYWNPARRVCRERLMREFDELTY